MAKQKIPGFLKKRNLLYNTKNKDMLEKYGDMFLEKEFYDDALEFYVRGESKDRFSKIIESAKAIGDLVLYKKVLKFAKVESDSNVLNVIGEKAFELGKLLVAKDAFTDAKNKEMLRKVEAELERVNPSVNEAVEE